MPDGTGIPPVDTAVVWALALAALAALAGLIWRATRGVWRIGSMIDDFFDDWKGTPARPGAPARPGVMDRLARLERVTEEIRYEIRPNSGRSLRDAVDRVDAAVTGGPGPPDTPPDSS
ncbi:hypothetical protein [Streptomyces sp. NPDC090026]|uniref:hypothetical protein n=1 Tax=Streptomyces sp. NPDC090026 TaxID=3365923 RepID=UPI003800507D